MKESKTRRQILALGISPFEAGEHFKRWPTHITLVPWFVGTDTEKLSDNLEILARKTKSINICVGERALFGADHDVPVHIIEPNPKLAALHALALNLIYYAGGTIEDFNYIDDRYKPHVTLKPGVELKDNYKLDTFALISAEPRGSRLVEKVYTLNG